MPSGPRLLGLFTIALVLTGSPLVRAAGLPLAEDPAAAQDLLATAKQGQSVYVADLAKGDNGELFTGTTANLPAGRYRLHAVVSVAPLGNLIVSLVQLRITVADAERTCSVIHFPRDDDFVDLTLDFVSRGRAVDVGLHWFTEEDSKTKGLKGNRELAILNSGEGGGADGATGLADLELDDDDGLDLELDDETATFPLAEARQRTYRMVLAGAFVEALSPLEVAVRTSKICYVPGEPGNVAVTFSNRSRQAVQTTPTVALHWGLDQSRMLACDKVSVPPGGTTTVSLDFATDKLYWGAEIVAAAAVAGHPPGRGREIFAVRRNIWETAVTAAHPAHMAVFDDVPAAQAAATKLRDAGYNGFEAFFWGPCDMLEFTPETERWVSGQTAYPGSVTGTRNLIEACHDEGIFATVYANLWGGSGPPAMEVQRRHPEWFGDASYRTYVLEDWDLLGPWQDMREARLRAPGIAAWCFNQLFIDPLPGVFDWHADELIGTHRMFGWDGVRYDSAYSREWSVKAMRQVRARVEAQVPTFQFGYNSFAHNDYRALALDDMVGGGGMIMAEGIRLERGQNISNFAGEVLSWRDVIWPYGGHGPGMIFRNSTDEEVMTPVGIEYQGSIILAGGGHLYYDPPHSDLSGFPHFALRYSEYIYDNRMRALRDAEAVVSFGGNATFLAWQRFARTLDLGEDKRRLVLHLINPPVNENPFKDKTFRVPMPQMNVPLAVSLPPGAAVTGAWELGASPAAWHRALASEMRDGAVHLVVPDIRFWTCVVLEYTSPTPLPRAVTVKDQTDTFLQDWYVAGPFPGDTELSSFDTPLAPESGVDLQATYAGVGGQTIAWQRNRPDGAPKLGRFRLDVRGLLDLPNMPGVAYAYSTVTAAAEREVSLFVGYDEVVKIWVNGVEVFRSGEPVELSVDAAEVKVTLRQGPNEILVKIGQRWLGWSLALRIADDHGAPIYEGLSY